jgi:very-short-patch-repair endonuclease
MIRVRGRFDMREADEIKTGRARRLRKAATDAEAALWYRLRSRRLNGFKFVRQEPIGPYTVDLICRELRLIIEVDGGQHADNRRDAVRDKWLVGHNYRVLRFWNNDVLGNMVGVLETIAAALAEAPPHPDR